jgi:predicted anti-sigma-YlaC factor YlaD
MDCNHIKNQLLLYLDNELEPAQQQAVQNHLANCLHCTEHLHQLTQFWGSPEVIESVEPSPWLWSRIAARLSAAKSRRDYFTEVCGWIFARAVPVAAVAIIMIGVLTGIYLGSLPQDTTSSGSASIALVNARTDFIKTSHLDAFDDLSPASVGGAYLALETSQP